MDPGGLVGRRWGGMLCVPEATEEDEDSGQAVGVVVVLVGEDDVGYVWVVGLNVVPRAVEECGAEEWGVLVLAFAGVDEDVGVVLPDEVCVCSYVREGVLVRRQAIRG